MAIAATEKGKRRTLTQRDARLGLSLMSPTLLIVLVIIVFPLLWAILISFQRLRLIEIGRADFFRPLSLPITSGLSLRESCGPVLAPP